MPRYDYKCGVCGRVFEVSHTLARLPVNKALRCKCGAQAVRQPSAVTFTVQGFNAKNGYTKEKP